MSADFGYFNWWIEGDDLWIRHSCNGTDVECKAPSRLDGAGKVTPSFRCKRCGRRTAILRACDQIDPPGRIDALSKKRSHHRRTAPPPAVQGAPGPDDAALAEVLTVVRDFMHNWDWGAFEDDEFPEDWERAIDVAIARLGAPGGES